MRKLLFALIALCASSVSAQYFPVDTLALNRSYAKLMETPADTTSQREFFNAFPGTWLDYLYTYNYIYRPDYDLTMYHHGPYHCDAFGKLTAIPDSVYCDKLVNLAVGALNGADTPYYLQSLEHNSMATRRAQMLRAITSMMTADRMLYWQFFWSNRLFQKAIEKEYQELDAWMRANGYADEAELMKIAYDNFHGKSSDELNGNHIGLRKYEVNHNN